MGSRKFEIKLFFVPVAVGSSSWGGCSIRLLAKDSDLATVDCAFKLLTSPDIRVADEAAVHMREVTARRTCCEPQPGDIANYLSGVMIGVFREHRGTTVNSVWSRARNAADRLKVAWVTDGDLSIAHEGTIMRAKQRREVMKTLRESTRLARSRALIQKPDRGGRWSV